MIVLQFDCGTRRHVSTESSTAATRRPSGASPLGPLNPMISPLEHSGRLNLLLIFCRHQCSYFASASRDRSARLWTSERTFPLRSYVGHTLAVDVRLLPTCPSRSPDTLPWMCPLCRWQCVEFHPNNSYLATGSQDRTVRLWSTQDGKCVRLLQGHKSNILCLAFSPNGKQLASSGLCLLTLNLSQSHHCWRPAQRLNCMVLWCWHCCVMLRFRGGQEGAPLGPGVWRAD